MLHNLKETALVFGIVRFGNGRQRLLDCFFGCGAFERTFGLLAGTATSFARRSFVVAVVAVRILQSRVKGGTLTELGRQERRVRDFVFRESCGVGALASCVGGFCASSSSGAVSAVCHIVGLFDRWIDRLIN